jgi:3,4-dihydroxy 2-butanone 4-phosphate synthase/GTP cyclohydrolase II
MTPRAGTAAHNRTSMPFCSIPEALDDFRAGRMLVVVDDEDRENEGDLTLAAEKVTPELINFMAMHGRGLICLALSPEKCDDLHLPLMSPTNTSRFGTAFCEAVDAADGVTTGISAADRAHTIRVAMRPNAKPSDLARPGHVFPLRAKEGGVLVRAGQTEAAVDLARLSGFAPGGVICEIMNPDGTMARVPELEVFCGLHNLKMISVADLIRHRLQNERFIRKTAEGKVQTPYGEFRSMCYTSNVGTETHLALTLGDVKKREPVLVRMHARCVYGDIFGSVDCDCHATLEGSMKKFAEEGAGVLVYLHHTGAGMRLQKGDGCPPDKMLPHLRDSVYSPNPDNQRRLQHEAGIGAQILCDLGLRKIRLLTNHPRKVVGLEAYGIEIVDQIPVLF